MGLSKILAYRATGAFGWEFPLWCDLTDIHQLTGKFFYVLTKDDIFKTVDTMAAVLASETAMAAVLASETAMAAVAASETAMAAVAASETARLAIFASADTAMPVFTQSPIAFGYIPIEDLYNPTNYQVSNFGGEYVLETSYRANERAAMSILRDDYGDVEVVAQFYPKGTGEAADITIRASGSAGNESRYYLAPSGTSNRLRLNKDVNGDFSTLAEVTDVYTSWEDWWWLKLRVEGSSIKGKIWKDGTPEPNWQINVTDTSLSTGKVCFGGYTAVGAYWRYFGVKVL